MTRDPNATAVLGVASKAARRHLDLRPGMVLEPARSIPAAELARLHTADIARLLGRPDIADRIEDDEISALLGADGWELE